MLWPFGIAGGWVGAEGKRGTGEKQRDTQRETETGRERKREDGKEAEWLIVMLLGLKGQGWWYCDANVSRNSVGVVHVCVYSVICRVCRLCVTLLILAAFFHKIKKKSIYLDRYRDIYR